MRNNKIILSILLAAFLLNSFLPDVTLAQELFSHNSDKLAPALWSDDITGIARKDIGRIEVLLETVLRLLAEKAVKIEDLTEKETIREYINSIIPNDMQPFFSEIEVLPKFGKCIKWKFQDKKNGTRIYRSVYSDEKGSDGGFFVAAYTEEAYKRTIKPGFGLPARKVEDAKAIQEYAKHERAIDEFTAKKIADGEFTEILGRAVQVIKQDDPLSLAGTKKIPSFYVLPVFLEMQGNALRTFLDVLGLSFDKVFEGRNIVFIKGRPKTEYKGTEISVNVHVSPKQVFFYLDDDIFNSLKSVKYRYELTPIAEKLHKDFAHAMGKIYRLYFYKANGRLINRFDEAYEDFLQNFSQRVREAKDVTPDAQKYFKEKYPDIFAAIEEEKPDLDDVIYREYAGGKAKQSTGKMPIVTKGAAPIAATVSGAPLKYLAMHKLGNALIQTCIEYAKKHDWKFAPYDKKERVFWLGNGYQHNFYELFVYLSGGDYIDLAAKLVIRAGLENEIQINGAFVRDLMYSFTKQVAHNGVAQDIPFIMACYRGTDLGNAIIKHERAESDVHNQLVEQAFGGDLGAFRDWREAQGGDNPLRLAKPVKIKVGQITVTLPMEFTYNQFAQMTQDYTAQEYPVSITEPSGQDLLFTSSSPSLASGSVPIAATTPAPDEMKPALSPLAQQIKTRLEQMKMPIAMDGETLPEDDDGFTARLKEKKITWTGGEFGFKAVTDWSDTENYCATITATAINPDLCIKQDHNVLTMTLPWSQEAGKPKYEAKTFNGILLKAFGYHYGTPKGAEGKRHILYVFVDDDFYPNVKGKIFENATHTHRIEFIRYSRLTEAREKHVNVFVVGNILGNFSKPKPAPVKTTGITVVHDPDEKPLPPVQQDAVESKKTPAPETVSTKASAPETVKTVPTPAPKPVNAKSRPISLKDLADHRFVNALLGMAIEYASSDEGLKNDDGKFADREKDEPYITWFKGKTFADIFNKLVDVEEKRHQGELIIDDRRHEKTVVADLIKRARMTDELEKKGIIIKNKDGSIEIKDIAFIDDLKLRFARQVKHFGRRPGGRIFAMDELKGQRKAVIDNSMIENGVITQARNKAFAGDYAELMKWAMSGIALGNEVKEKIIGPGQQKILLSGMTYEQLAEKAFELAQKAYPLHVEIPDNVLPKEGDEGSKYNAVHTRVPTAAAAIPGQAPTAKEPGKQLLRPVPNDVDYLFIDAEDLIVLKHDFKGAKELVNKAIDLLRTVDYYKLNRSGIPEADMISQLDTATWVLEQLKIHKLIKGPSEVLIDALRKGHNGLELKKILGYKPSAAKIGAGRNLKAAAAVTAYIRFASLHSFVMGGRAVGGEHAINRLITIASDSTAGDIARALAYEFLAMKNYKTEDTDPVKELGSIVNESKDDTAKAIALRGLLRGSEHPLKEKEIEGLFAILADSADNTAQAIACGEIMQFYVNAHTDLYIIYRDRLSNIMDYSHDITAKMIAAGYLKNRDTVNTLLTAEGTNLFEKALGYDYFSTGAEAISESGEKGDFLRLLDGLIYEVAPIDRTLTIGSGQDAIEVPNRRFAQPMERNSCPGGHVSQLLLDSYARLAKLGYGVVGIEAASIGEDRARYNQLRIGPGYEEDIRKLVQQIRDNSPFGKDQIICVQPNHSGSVSDSRFSTVVRTYTPLPGDKDSAPGKLLTDKDVEPIIQAFVDAAVVAYGAGANMVDIKSCHGYLLGQFLRPANIAREDWTYGGSLENRTRIVEEILKRIRQRVPDKRFKIMTRFSLYEGDNIRGGVGTKGADSTEMDLTEPLEMIKRFAAAGSDIMNITAGIPKFNGADWVRPVKKDKAIKEPGNILSYHHIAFAKAGREALQQAGRPDVIIIGSGYSALQEDAESVANEALGKGYFDMVGFGRKTLAGENKCALCSGCSRRLLESPVGCVVHEPFYRLLDQARSRAKTGALNDDFEKAIRGIEEDIAALPQFNGDVEEIVKYSRTFINKQILAGFLDAVIQVIDKSENADATVKKLPVLLGAGWRTFRDRARKDSDFKNLVPIIDNLCVFFAPRNAECISKVRDAAALYQNWLAYPQFTPSMLEAELSNSGYAVISQRAIEEGVRPSSIGQAPIAADDAAIVNEPDGVDSITQLKRVRTGIALISAYDRLAGMIIEREAKTPVQRALAMNVLSACSRAQTMIMFGDNPAPDDFRSFRKTILDSLKNAQPGDISSALKILDYIELLGIEDITADLLRNIIATRSDEGVRYRKSVIKLDAAGGRLPSILDAYKKISMISLQELNRKNKDAYLVAKSLLRVLVSEQSGLSGEQVVMSKFDTEAKNEQLLREAREALAPEAIKKINPQDAVLALGALNDIGLSVQNGLVEENPVVSEIFAQLEEKAKEAKPARDDSKQPVKEPVLKALPREFEFTLTKASSELKKAAIAILMDEDIRLMKPSVEIPDEYEGRRIIITIKKPGNVERSLWEYRKFVVDKNTDYNKYSVWRARNEKICIIETETTPDFHNLEDIAKQLLAKEKADPEWQDWVRAAKAAAETPDIVTTDTQGLTPEEVTAQKESAGIIAGRVAEVARTLADREASVPAADDRDIAPEDTAVFLGWEDMARVSPSEIHKYPGDMIRMRLDSGSNVMGTVLSGSSAEQIKLSEVRWLDGPSSSEAQFGVAYIKAAWILARKDSAAIPTELTEGIGSVAVPRLIDETTAEELSRLASAVAEARARFDADTLLSPESNTIRAAELGEAEGKLDNAMAKISDKSVLKEALSKIESSGAASRIPDLTKRLRSQAIELDFNGARSVNKTPAATEVSAATEPDTANITGSELADILRQQKAADTQTVDVTNKMLNNVRKPIGIDEAISFALSKQLFMNPTTRELMLFGGGVERENEVSDQKPLDKNIIAEVIELAEKVSIGINQVIDSGFPLTGDMPEEGLEEQNKFVKGIVTLKVNLRKLLGAINDIPTLTEIKKRLTELPESRIIWTEPSKGRSICIDMVSARVKELEGLSSTAPTATEVSTAIEPDMANTEIAMSEAGEAGSRIPTSESEHNVILVPTEFFGNGELDNYQSTYANRFNLVGISTKNAATFLDRVTNHPQLVKGRSIVIVPDEFGEGRLEISHLKVLKDAGIKFVVASRNSMLNVKKFGETIRENFWGNEFGTVDVLCDIRPDDKGNATFNTAERLVQRRINLPKGMTAADYIKAFVTNDVVKLINAQLKPIQSEDIEAYHHTLSEALIFA